jgi:hypothetical protein
MVPGAVCGSHVRAYRDAENILAYNVGAGHSAETEGVVCPRAGTPEE